jgi:hypothetical protein
MGHGDTEIVVCGPHANARGVRSPHSKHLEIVEIATSGGDTLLGVINDLLDVEKI